MIKAGIKPENITYLTYYSDVYKDVNPFKGIVFTNPADNKDSDWAKYGGLIILITRISISILEYFLLFSLEILKL